MSVTRY